MCYSATTSLLTFVVMAISTIYLINRNYPNDIWFSIIFISAGLMQLVEYFMWKDQSCGLTNHLSTISAFLILLIQPLATLLGAYYFGDLVFDRKKLYPIIWIYGIIIGIIAIIGINYGRKNRLCSLPNGIHLDWDISKLFGGKMLIYIFFFLYYAMFFILLLSKPWYLGFIIATMLFGSILFSVFFIKNPSWKSLWCWIVNFIPIIYIIISYFRKILAQPNINL
jgi:hypothetical protein